MSRPFFSQYAEDLLDRMDDAAKQDYINERGAAAFIELWRSAYGARRDAPRIPARLSLGDKVVRRSEFDSWPARQRNEHFRNGGSVVD